MLTATTSNLSLAELGLQRIERRHLLAARHAPGGPQVQQHGLALEVGERARLAVGVREGEVGQALRIGRDADRRDLAARERGEPLGELGGGPARRIGRIALHRADPVYRREPDRDARDSAEQHHGEPASGRAFRFGRSSAGFGGRS